MLKKSGDTLSQEFAGRGELKWAVIASKQRDFKLALELSEALRHCGLGQT